MSAGKLVAKRGWSKAEEEKLRELFPIKKMAELAKEFGRTDRCIGSKAARMGLTQGRFAVVDPKMDSHGKDVQGVKVRTATDGSLCVRDVDMPGLARAKGINARLLGSSDETRTRRFAYVCHSEHRWLADVVTGTLYERDTGLPAAASAGGMRIAMPDMGDDRP